MTYLNTTHLRKSDYPLIVLHKLGVFKFIHCLYPNTLTVLNYHRVDDVRRTEFDSFRPNVSATPLEFSRQMEYVSLNYHVITIMDLIEFIQKGKSLPSRAALITFDDGYSDNYKNAFPILKKYNLPAVIFLATDFIDSTRPFYWDLIAYCFQKTQKDYAALPPDVVLAWSDQVTREKGMLYWIELLKKLPDAEKSKIVESLPEILDVSVPAGQFQGLTISWAQAREMVNHGIEMGGHTASHPILSRISLEKAIVEISTSKYRIEDEIGKPVLSMAYPNGQRTDFNSEIMEQVRKVGYEAAFSLLSGPTRYSSVLRQPMAIRRIFLGYEDNFSRFVAKLTGVPRLFSRW